MRSLSRFAPAAFALLTACGGATPAHVPENDRTSVASAVEAPNYSAAITSREAIISKINREIDQVRFAVGKILERDSDTVINWDELLSGKTLNQEAIEVAHDGSTNGYTNNFTRIAEILGVELADPNYIQRTQARIIAYRNAGRILEAASLERELTEKLSKENLGLIVILDRIEKVRRELDDTASGSKFDAELGGGTFELPPKVLKGSPLD